MVRMTNNKLKISKQKKQIIVTGGLGFVGQHLTQALIKHDYLPIVVDKLPSSSVKKVINRYNLKVNKDFIFLKGDIRNTKWLEKKLKKYRPSAVIHLAAIHFIPYCDEHRVETIQVNVQGTQVLLELCKKMGIQKFIFASTAAVYKPSARPHSETDIVAPVDIYGASKKMAEDLILLYAKTLKLSPVILRLFNIYGPGDRNPHFIPLMVKQIRKSKTIFHGNLQSIRDYVYVDDVVSAIMLVLQKDKLKNTIYNLGTGIGYSGTQVIKTLCKILKRNVKHEISKKQLRSVDRKKLLANTEALSGELQWSPKYHLHKGLNSLLEKNERANFY